MSTKKKSKPRAKVMITVTSRQKKYLDEYKKTYDNKPSEIVGRLLDQWIKKIVREGEINTSEL